MPARRLVYPLLITLVLTTVFICSFSVESFTAHRGGGFRDARGAMWLLHRANVETIHSSTNDCVKPLMSDPTNGFQPLPLSVVDGVMAFVFFIGIGRSGHSIVASILDSHPHMVVSNELNLFKMLNTTSCAAANKSFIFVQPDLAQVLHTGYHKP